jgi:hypothetical protein
MGGIFSSYVAQSSNTQIASANINQNFVDDCKITCGNIQSGDRVNINNSFFLGDIDLLQQCSVNGQCYSTNNMDATADVMFKANLTSSAQGPVLQLCDVCSEIATTASLQDIQETINENTISQCDISTLNQMKDVDVYVNNSTILGSLVIGQTGSATGGCTFNNSMNAAAYATGSVSLKSTTGKDKKQSSLGTGILYYVGIGLGIIILLVFAYYIAKLLLQHYGNSDSKPTTKTE